MHEALADAQAQREAAEAALAEARRTAAAAASQVAVHGVLFWGRL